MLVLQASTEKNIYILDEFQCVSFVRSIFQKHFSPCIMKFIHLWHPDCNFIILRQEMLHITQLFAIPKHEIISTNIIEFVHSAIFAIYCFGCAVDIKKKYISAARNIT